MDVESIIEKFHHIDDRIDIDESNLTPIQEFYKDAKIFITGATGFLGQVMVEKLLRSCPVSTLYLLVRSKKGKDSETRLNEIFGDMFFDRMKKACPNFRQKVVLVEGDCALADLGLSLQDKKLLIEKVNVVFHIAATIRFNEKLRTAATVNLKASRDLSQLARQMTKLKSFVHVSTAYSNCTQTVIEEKVYTPSMDFKHLLDIVETCDDHMLSNLTPNIIGKYPNTYTFTKQIAENVVKEETRGLPAGIYRPSIVISTYMEPIKGWINSIYGVSGMVLGSGLGVVRVVRGDPDNKVNIVPVDMCINGLIASAWDVARRFEESKHEQFEIPVYNYESSNDQKLTWDSFRDQSCKYTYIFQPCNSLWITILYMIKSHRKYLMLTFLLHYIPGMIVDAFLFCKGKKMRLFKTYQKIHTFSKLLTYFTITHFDFRSTNIRTMLTHMSERDRQIFFCDLKEIIWDDFFLTYPLGCRVYLGKDPVETIPQAMKRNRRLALVHKITMAVLRLLAITTLWFLMSNIYKTIFV